MAERPAISASASASVGSSPRTVSEHERRVAATGATSTSLDKLGYSWEQTDLEVRIFFSLETPDAEAVQCEFSKRGCALTAAVGQQRYFFEIKRTYAPIDPALSLVKVRRSGRQVAVRLRKGEPGVEWPALRCMDGGGWAV